MRTLKELPISTPNRRSKRNEDSRARGWAMRLIPRSTQCTIQDLTPTFLLIGSQLHDGTLPALLFNLRNGPNERTLLIVFSDIIHYELKGINPIVYTYVGLGNLA